MIYEFVDKILVHAPDRSTGDRTQEVDIYLKFIGKFDVPLPEPTAEELAEMEKQRKQRTYYRERSRRQRERDKQKKLSEQEKTHKALRALAIWQAPFCSVNFNPCEISEQNSIGRILFRGNMQRRSTNTVRCPLLVFHGCR